MKKKNNISLIVICLITFLSAGIISLSNTIVTQRQKYFVEAPDVYPEVSTRELAMLASLVYEDVPNDYKYEDMKNGAGCVTKEGILKNKDELEGGKCFFANLNNDKGYKVKNSKHSVRAYIEGMSKRKMGFVTWLTSSSVENGQEYYFLDFADVKELKDWTIFDYQSDRIGIYNEKIYYENGSKFEVITFKKGDNYVISYRGTDFPDVWEWLDDFAYALTGTSNTQTKKAYEYAQNVYDLIRDDNKNANIYVTGHSLGAFLAQVGGAAIVDKEAGINLYDAKELASHSGKISDLENLDDYKKMYHKTNSRLKQVAYFNGMGITGIIRSGVFSRSMNSSLIYLSTHNQDGSVATGDKTVNYSTDNMPLKSSGRLVLYTMEGDPISNIGFHYGEIYELSVGTGAIKNHVGNHSHILNGEGLSDIANLVTDLFNGEYVSKYTITENLSKTAANFIKLTEKANNLVPNKNIPKFVSTYNPDIKNYSIMSLITNFLNSKKKLADKYNINGIIDFFNVGHETDSFVCLSDGENGKIEDADTLNFAFAAPNRLKLKTDNHLSDLYQSETYAKYLQPEGYNVGDFINYNLEDLPNYLILDIIVKGTCARGFIFEYSMDDGASWNPITGKSGSKIIYNSSIIIPQSLIEEAIDKTDPNNGDYVHNIKFRGTILYGDSYAEQKSAIDKNNGTISYETKSKCITDNSGINCKQDSKEYYKYTFKNELNLNVYNYYVSN